MCRQIMEENEIALRTLSVARSAFRLHAQEMSNLSACVQLGAMCDQNQQGPDCSPTSRGPLLDQHAVSKSNVPFQLQAVSAY